MLPPGFRPWLTGTLGKVSLAASGSFQAASFLPHGLLMPGAPKKRWGSVTRKKPMS